MDVYIDNLKAREYPVENEENYKQDVLIIEVLIWSGCFVKGTELYAHTYVSEQYFVTNFFLHIRSCALHF